MNERIRELAEQADAYAWQQIDEGANFDEQPQYFAEKFAELIVQECMNAVCDPNTTYLESMTESSAMYTARERIRKHFRS